MGDWKQTTKNGRVVSMNFLCKGFAVEVGQYKDPYVFLSKGGHTFDWYPKDDSQFPEIIENIDKCETLGQAYEYLKGLLGIPDDTFQSSI